MTSDVVVPLRRLILRLQVTIRTAPVTRLPLSRVPASARAWTTQPGRDPSPGVQAVLVAGFTVVRGLHLGSRGLVRAAGWRAGDRSVTALWGGQEFGGSGPRGVPGWWLHLLLSQGKRRETAGAGSCLPRFEVSGGSLGLGSCPARVDLSKPQGAGAPPQQALEAITGGVCAGFPPLVSPALALANADPRFSAALASGPGSTTTSALVRASNRAGESSDQVMCRSWIQRGLAGLLLRCDFNSVGCPPGPAALGDLLRAIPAVIRSVPPMFPVCTGRVAAAVPWG